jgi:hypothetical protein
VAYETIIAQAHPVSLAALPTCRSEGPPALSWRFGRRDSALFRYRSRALLERDDFSSNRHHALTYSWSMIFSEKPVPTPHRVRGRLFRDHARVRTIRCRRFCQHHEKTRPTGFAEQYDDREIKRAYADVRALIFTSPSTSSVASKIREWREWASLILFREDGAVHVQEASPGTNGIGAGLQVGGVGLGQRPRGGDLPIFAAVGGQNGQQVRHELLVPWDGVLHGFVPVTARNRRTCPRIALPRPHRLPWSVLCDSRNTLAAALVFRRSRAYMGFKLQ